ncbi:thioesterase [Niastella yeongjuensis]|uniref:Thioesterase n=1 Tax=Niastella yeongjuensis TaxID=354355 RepID=A0A1V9F0C4_9BACT|nr:thioesterase family protein [Niastella yeongjuensis]OQP51745.1 thioesterase [Niastella yeongjuensis]SEP48828.1 Acyl-CoA thioesterase FadM [Niastella yeongjuensis]
MARIKVELPEQFVFSTTIPVRITDLNYGKHVGNDTILSMIHEARVQYLKQLGYGELDLAGVGVIMSDVGIEFKSELFYGDEVIASVAAGDITKVSFDLYYKLEKRSGNTTQLVAVAKTGMVCYDYAKKKVAAIPTEVAEKLKS